MAHKLTFCLVTSPRVPAAELDSVFGLLANELRIDILRTLWAQHPESLSFSDLRSSVDIRDSGKFNYHLDVLVPKFVRKSDGEYLLTHAGRQVIGAAVSRTLTDADDVIVEDVPAGECMFCNGSLMARYENGVVTVDCAACDDLITRMPIPPNTVANIDAEALPEVFSKHLLTVTHQLSRGFCKLCYGQVDASLTVFSSVESVTYCSPLDVQFECRECGDQTHLNAGGVVMDHPAVMSLLFDAGIDLRRIYIWELTSLLDPEVTTVSEDPLQLHLTIHLNGETLDLTLDDTATVIAYDRR